MKGEQVFWKHDKVVSTLRLTHFKRLCFPLASCLVGKAVCCFFNFGIWRSGVRWSAVYGGHAVCSGAWCGEVACIISVFDGKLVGMA